MSSVEILQAEDVISWSSLLDFIGADVACLPRLSLRDRITLLKVDDLSCPAASILKQCMLSGGADALVHREVITCRVEKSSAVIYGTPATILKGCNSLQGQPFGLPSLGREIASIFSDYPRLSVLMMNNKKLIYTDTPLVMGILNVTPDSFSDGGRFLSVSTAVKEALNMQKAGASIIDIGGESTRPGSDSVSSDQQIERVIPVIKAIREISDIPISIDTTIPDVAEKAISAGAGLVNSIDALETEGMIELVSSLSVPVVIMHKKGKPKTMQQKPFYNNAVNEISSYLVDRVDLLHSAGIAKEDIIVDPGIGFGKRFEDNIALIRGLAQIKNQTGCRILLGHSRKSFLKEITGLENPCGRDSATHIITVLAKSADIVRVHDVQGTVSSLRIREELRRLK